MASQATFEKVAAMIAESREVDLADIKKDTTFEDLGLDSLDTVEMVMAFEEEFGVSIEVNENLKTVGDVATLIDELLG